MLIGFGILQGPGAFLFLQALTSWPVVATHDNTYKSTATTPAAIATHSPTKGR